MTPAGTGLATYTNSFDIVFLWPRDIFLPTVNTHYYWVDEDEVLQINFSFTCTASTRPEVWTFTYLNPLGTITLANTGADVTLTVNPSVSYVSGTHTV